MNLKRPKDTRWSLVLFTHVIEVIVNDGIYFEQTAETNTLINSFQTFQFTFCEKLFRDYIWIISSITMKRFKILWMQRSWLNFQCIICKLWEMIDETLYLFIFCLYFVPKIILLFLIWMIYANHGHNESSNHEKFI